MKKIIFIFVGIAIFSVSSLFAQNEQQAAVKKFLKEWAASLQTGDVNKIASLYDDSNDVIAIQSTGIVRKGIGEIRKEYENAFREVIFEKTELQNLIIRQQGQIAWASYQLKADTMVRQSGEAWILEIYTSFVLKHSGGQWRIVLEQSTPIAGIPRVRPRQQPITDEK
jgi:uncharacterized protein (TIGR02246 family)